MQKSGEHDNEPFNYMQLAVKDISSITVDAAYYFYMRCEEYPEIDAEFQSFMNPELKGSSEDFGPEGSATSSITAGISSGGGGSRNKRKSIDRVSNDIQEYKRLSIEQGSKRLETQENIDSKIGTIKSCVVINTKLQNAYKKLDMAYTKNNQDLIDKYETMIEKLEEQLDALN
jgi:hypothetical protein